MTCQYWLDRDNRDGIVVFALLRYPIDQPCRINWYGKYEFRDDPASTTDRLFESIDYLLSRESPISRWHSIGLQTVTFGFMNEFTFTGVYFLICFYSHTYILYLCLYICLFFFWLFIFISHANITCREKRAVRALTQRRGETLLTLD